MSGDDDSHVADAGSFMAVSFSLIGRVCVCVGKGQDKVKSLVYLCPFFIIYSFFFFLQFSETNSLISITVSMTITAIVIMAIIIINPFILSKSLVEYQRYVFQKDHEKLIRSVFKVVSHEQRHSTFILVYSLVSA